MSQNAIGHLNPDIRSDAQRSVLRTALQILHRAWPGTISDSRVSTSSSEDSITDVLRWKMEEVKAAMNPSPQMRFEREPQSDAAGGDAAVGYIDIMVAYTWKAETYLVIECKRLSESDNSLAMKYVRNGTNRFASEKYGPRHAYGAMVGYVCWGDTEKCIATIGGVLNSEPFEETGFDRDHGWRWDEDVIPGVRTGSTRHQQRPSLNVIELVHVFFGW